MRDPLHPILVRNESGEEIPAFAVMVVTGLERLDEKTVFTKVDKFSGQEEEGFQVLVNSAKPIGITGDERYGWARVPWAAPGWVAYDTDDGTPAFREEWGLEEGEWVLKEDGTSFPFRILGLPDEEQGRVLASYVQTSNDCPNNFRVILVGNPTTGTFSLTITLPDGSDTLTFNWDDTANEVETAIQFHAHWQVGYEVEALDGPWPHHSISFQLGGDLVGETIAIPTVSAVNLSGGARSGVRVERASCEEV